MFQRFTRAPGRDHVVLLVALLVGVCIHGAEAKFLALRGRRAQQEDGEPPKSLLLGPPHEAVEVVVKSIADYMWHNETSKFKDRPPQKFIIAGSYASAVKSYEHDHDLVLPYNDIDVFVQYEYKCNGRINKVYYNDDIIPHTNIPINFVHVCEDLDLEEMVEGFDINAIMIGFEVEPVYDSKLHKVVPKVRWYWDPAFETFLATKTMEVIREGKGRYAGSLIRLLYKAQQSGVNYKIWDHDKLMTTVHGSTFSTPYKKKMEKLVGPYKSELYNRFKVWKMSGTRYMLVLKDKTIPPPPDPKQIQRELTMNGQVGGYMTGEPEDGPPTNNECTIAHALRVNERRAGTVLGATPSTNIFNLGVDTDGPTVWYSFVGTGETLRLRLNCGETPFNAGVTILGGTCEEYDFQTYYGSRDMCRRGFDIANFETVQGKQYLILLEGYTCVGSCLQPLLPMEGSYHIILEPQ